MKRGYSLKNLNSLIVAAVVALAITPHAASQKFYADDPVSEDVVNQDASHVRTVDIDHMSYGWVTDITYIRTWQAWLYLAVVMDLYERPRVLALICRSGLGSIHPDAV
jgi:transposase InsO family protein